MTNPHEEQPISSTCWCGASEGLPAIHDVYTLCAACGTGRLRNGSLWDPSSVAKLYESDYWRTHMEEELGLPTIEERLISDLPERCCVWLDILLEYLTPPARTLELGCAHGGFVKLLELAGFHATGMEMDKHIRALAKETFDVHVDAAPLLPGKPPEGPIDAICLFDVLEHIPDPRGALTEVRSRLSDSGLVLIQTPDVVACTSSTNQNWNEPEHIYLFSKDSLTTLLSSVGLNHIVFVPSLFGTDMTCVASPKPLEKISPEAALRALQTSPTGRFVAAMRSLRHDRERLRKEIKQNYRTFKQAIDATPSGIIQRVKTGDLTKREAAAQMGRILAGGLRRRCGGDKPKG